MRTTKDFIAELYPRKTWWRHYTETWLASWGGLVDLVQEARPIARVWMTLVFIVCLPVLFIAITAVAAGIAESESAQLGEGPGK